MAKSKTTGLYRRGDIWHIDKYYRGQRIRGSSFTSNREEAEEFLRKKLEEVRNAQLYGVRPKHTFVSAATYYLETKKKRSLELDAYHLKLVVPYIGDRYLEDVHDLTLRPFIRARYKAGIKPKTINNTLGVVRHVLTSAATAWRDEQGFTWLAQVPKITMESLAGTQAKPYPLSWSEQDRLLRELEDDLAEVCLFKVNTGLREREVCELRWDWEFALVDHDASVFMIPAGWVKNKEERLVILNDVARSIVDRQRSNGSEWVFPSPRTGEPRVRLNNSGYKSAWRRAGLPVSSEWKRGVHNLKHTFGRRLRAAGVCFEDRQVLLGHTNGSITTHYCGPEILKLIEAANRVCRTRPEAVLIRVTSQKFPQNPHNGKRVSRH